MKREKVEFTKEQLKYIEEIEGFEYIEVTQTYYDSEKHYVDKEIILKRVSDGKFFKGEFSDWGSGGKEWFDYTFKEVFPKQVTTTVYE
jgi:hypothetical protein